MEQEFGQVSDPEVIEKIEHYAPRTIQGHIKKWLLAKGETELGSTQPTE